MCGGQTDGLTDDGEFSHIQFKIETPAWSWLVFVLRGRRAWPGTNDPENMYVLKKDYLKELHSLIL